MKAIDDGDLHPDQVESIATKLGVTNNDVVQMNRRMSGPDASLNAPLRSAEGDSQWQDWLEDENYVSQETQVVESDEFSTRMELLQDAMANLNEREQDIIQQRKLSEEPKTLEELAQTYGVSRERIRQIEVRAFEKLQAAMLEQAKEKGLLDA
ncbi:MAG: sigma-70 family RNA polymerase sigma factor [Robiginitomaculum sp.]|nr:sigma-70 family RNA polymerase sigma factor [Robiginitomaculum sp.]